MSDQEKNPFAAPQTAQTADTASDPSTYRDLIRVVRSARRRWRTRIALRGFLVVGVAGFAVFLLSILAMDFFLYSDSAVRWLRILTWVTLGALALRFFVLPVFQRVSQRRVALYIEEHEPSLEAALLSALELGEAATPGRSLSPSLRRGLLESAIAKCEEIDYAQRIERSGLRRTASALVGVAGTALIAILISPAFLQHGAALLFMPWKAMAADNPYRILVQPGDTEIARGSDLRVAARLVGFEADRVDLASKPLDGDSWQRVTMSPTEANELFGGAEERSMDLEVMLLDQQQTAEYYVETNGMRSPVFRIDVRELPYVDRLDYQLNFPAYTGLEPQKVEDGGDIAAIAGTEVVFEIVPTIPVSGGFLRFEEAEDIALELGEAGSLFASLRVAQRGFYRIDLIDAQGDIHRASPEYAITPLDDQPPLIEVTKPGRDTKATKIDEIFVELQGEDDYGLRKLELFYSVNGAEEQTLDLYSQRGRGRKNVTVGHTFFLEELDLQDGDFVSYYARATDGNSYGGAQSATSDMYFVEVRPFGQEYRRAPEGGGGMGGGGEMESALSERQREVIVATFNLIRDRKETDAKEWKESLATVALMEGRLQEQAATLVSRMSNRATLLGNDEFRKIIEELQAANPEMEGARLQLEGGDPKAALPFEQRALTHLQRAEATFRDVRVSFDPSGGGQGGGSQLSEDLADLFELELDKLRNQYEVVQRGQQEQVENAVDELQQKLKELARRQQQENERKSKMRGRPSSGGGGGGSQQQLLDETEEAARKLERLAREQSRPDLRETARRLREAVDEMRRSEAGSGSQPQRSAASGTAALERLEEARRLLDKSREIQLDREMEALSEQAQRIAGMQQRIRQEIDRMADSSAGSQAESSSSRPGEEGREGRPSGSGGASGGSMNVPEEEKERIQERKDRLGAEVEGLEQKMDRMARQARGEKPEVGRKLQDAANSIRKNQLKEKIRYSKNVIETGDAGYAEMFEREISTNIDELMERVEQAQGAMSGDGSESKEDALARARSLVEGLESMAERLGDQQREQGQRQAQGENPGAGEASRAGESQGEQGEQGEAGEGQNQAGEGEPGQGRQASRQGEGQQGQGNQPGQQPGQQGQAGEGEGSGRQARLGSRPGQEGGEQGEGEGSTGQPTTGGGNAASSRIGSSDGGWFQPGVFSTEDLRQLGRELQQRTREASELRRDLQNEGVPVQDLDQILAQMKGFNVRGLNNDPLALSRLRQEIVEGLRQFEFKLWRELAEEGSDAVRLTGDPEVPEGYEERVEEYFRSLARNGGGR